VSKMRLLPSSSKHSIMVPLNATLRWNRALSHTLRNAIVGASVVEAEQHHMTTCPRMPFVNESIKSHTTHCKDKFECEMKRATAKQLYLHRLRLGTYEMLRADTRGELRRLLEFFEFPVSDHLVDKTVRIVAERPPTEIKHGMTPVLVNETFTPIQRRYVDELCRTLDPFYSGVRHT
jgi:hypothetical protein